MSERNQEKIRHRLIVGCAKSMLFLVMLSMVSGCISYSDLKVKAIDAESGHPIEGAKVRLWYPYHPFHWFPQAETASEITDSNGVVNVPIARNPGTHSTSLRVDADGYILTDAIIRYENNEWQVLERHGGEHAKLVRANKQTPAVQFELFKQPRLTVYLEFERGYRGVIRLMVEEIENKRFPREISARVGDSGQVRVQVPEGLINPSHMDVEARYTDGTKIRKFQRPYEENPIMLHLLTRDRDIEDTGKVQYWVLGTENDFARIEDQVKVSGSYSEQVLRNMVGDRSDE